MPNKNAAIKKLARINQPRERLVALGAKNLSVAELLAVVLRTGSSKHSVLELAEKLSRLEIEKLKSLSLEELCRFSGIGFSKACSLLAVFELAQRLQQDGELIALNKPSKVFYQAFEIKDRKQEVCMALYVNGRRQLLHKKILSVGSLNQNFLEFREVLAPALTLPAAGLFLVHNHPSGCCEPSQQDIVVTQQMVQAANLMGINLIDHMIVSSSDYLSLKDKGLID